MGTRSKGHWWRTKCPARREPNDPFHPKLPRAPKFMILTSKKRRKRK